MTISYRNQTTLNSGVGVTTTVPLIIPSGAASGDAMFAVCAVKPYDLSIASGTYLTDYASLTNHANGSDANGIGVGSLRLFVGWRQHDGSESDPTMELSAAPSPRMSTVSVFQKTLPGGWDMLAGDADDTDVTGTTLTCTAGSTMDIKAGDLVLFIVAGGDDVAISSPSLSIPGCTLGTLTLINATNTTTQGNDGFIRFYRVDVTAGAATGAPSFTATAPTGDSDAVGVFIRMREDTPDSIFQTPARRGAPKAVQLASRM